MPPNLFYFFLSTFVFAILFGYIESEIERDKGWGSGFNPKRWYAKVSGINRFLPLGDFFGNIPLLNYHLILAFFFFPAVVGFFAFLFHIYNIFFIISAYTMTVSAEDFSWFVLNRHMHSLRELFKGEHGKIFWIKDWIRVGRFHIPRQYFFSLITAAIFILLGFQI